MSEAGVNSENTDTLRQVRVALLVLLLVGMSATTAELLLLAHDEDGLQLIPLVLCGIGLFLGIWNLAAPGPASVQGFRALMGLFVVSGIVGIALHYQANVEFQLETEPSLSGAALLWKVLQAKTPPALSPGLMVQLGLLGFVYSFRHPALRRGLEEGR